MKHKLFAIISKQLGCETRKQEQKASAVGERVNTLVASLATPPKNIISKKQRIKTAGNSPHYLYALMIFAK